MMLNRLVPVIAALAVVAGCAAQPQPPIAPAQSSAAFDGTYVGTVRVTGIGAGGERVRSICQTTPAFNVTIVDSAFTYAQPHPRYPGNPVVTYSVVISPTGYVSGTSDRNGALEGRIIDGRLSGTINGSGCFYVFSAQKR